MSTSTASSSTHYYVPLEGNEKAQAAGIGGGAGGSPRLVRGQAGGRRRCLTLSSGCICLLLVGLLLFFLVPRRPIVRYQSSTLALDEATAKVTLTQLFSYYNPNYYTVCVKGFPGVARPTMTSRSLIPHDLTPNKINACTRDRRNWNNLHIEVEDEATGTPLGFGWRNLSFPVGALHSESVAVDITITAAFQDLAPLIKAQCSDRGYVFFSSAGKAREGCMHACVCALCESSCGIESMLAFNL